MSNTYLLQGLCLKNALMDFSATINSNDNCLTEIAFANAGTSRFNSAMYFERLTEDDITAFGDSKINISFTNGLAKEELSGSVLGIKTIRRANDHHVKYKNIISFDLDFRQNMGLCGSTEREVLLEKFSTHIKIFIDKYQLPVWMMVFSGNGLHLHFKLREPYEIKSIQKYKRIYDAIRSYLECISGLNFDPACSNPARLIRLPFSTNWKNANSPISCAILIHNSEANFSAFFRGFESMIEIRASYREIARDKQAIIANLDLMKILKYFEYLKFDSVKEKNQKLICSSPFSTDSDPSFYYDSQRKLFYDFSSGMGGDLFVLIAQLAKIDIKQQFTHVLDLAATISGVSAVQRQENCFLLDEKGLWYSPSKDAESLWLSSPIFIEALTRDAQSQSWGRLLTFKDQDGVTKTWSMPMEMLASDGSEIRRNLLSLGAELSIGKRERNLFLTYLQDSRPERRAYCVNRIGWHQNQFVLPSRVYSPSNNSSLIILQSPQISSAFGISGTLEDWQKHIGAFCVGNSRLILASCAALASIILKWTGDESGGFSFVGPSSIGKSITLKVAASVWGNPGLNGFIKRWRSTLNGLELLAASRCDSLLVLDELGEISSKDAAYASYLLSGGTSKNRSTKDTNLANTLEWRLIFLSSGELTLASHVALSGAQVSVGQEVRMLDIPAESIGSQGIFENIHGFSSANEFASALAQNTEKYFGVAINDFLNKFIESPQQFVARIGEYRKIFLELTQHQQQHSQIRRALNRFSLLAAVGELAIQTKTLCWKPGEAIAGLQKCFNDWNQSWGLGKSRERYHLIQQIKNLLQEFGASRFPLLQDFKEHPYTQSQQLWGFRQNNEDRFEWVILSEIFKNTFCKGHDYRRALNDLREENFLVLGPSNQSSVPMRVPHLGVTRVVRLNASILL